MEQYPSIDARIFAALYDPFLALGERRSAAAVRARLLGSLSGDVLEIGAGTGLNVPHYPQDLEQLVLTEPDPAMLRRLRRRAGDRTTVVGAPAESLPFADDGFDAVVSTLVLCTAPEPGAALAEVARVLRPGGRLVLMEHVLAQAPRLARRQRRYARPWKALAGGCRCDQNTALLLSEAGFDVSGLRREAWRGMPSIVRPLVTGSLALR
ncbi:class I SAM-dependent methyltransferase [Spongisporangium articulatum]|uniref:Class I SAM-dependent methyltransferase n=1 Tax=Spongisporangium articulatum TaxID=3362603 RepID=A0ABW8ARQ8_9ACTN